MLTELGVADGISQNNTFLLEKQYAWSGLLIEPIKSQFQKLQENRAGTSTIKLNCGIATTEKEVLLYSKELESTWHPQIIDKKNIHEVEKINGI